MQPTLAESIDTFIGKREPSAQDFHAFLQLARSTTVGNREDAATVLFNLDRFGLHLFQTGRTEQGRSAFELAYEKALESLSNGVDAAPTCNLARRLHQLNWTNAALALLRESVQLTDSENASEKFVDLAAKPPRAAVLRNALGNLLREVGRFGEAEAELQQALHAVPPTEHGKASLELREVVLNNLGIVYAKKEDPARAVAALVESVRVQDELSLTGKSLAITLDNLGRAYLSLSRRRRPLNSDCGYINESAAQPLRRAVECFARAETIFKAAALPEGAEDFVICLINEADLALDLDNLDEAARVIGEARLVFMGSQLKNDAVMWLLIQKEVHLLRRQKRTADAMALLRPLLYAFPQSHPPANDTLSSLFELLATMSAEQGIVEDMLRAITLAASIDDMLLQENLAGSSEQQSFHMAEHIAERLERLMGASISFGYDGEGCTEWLYGLLLRRKGVLSDRIGFRWLEACSSDDERVMELSKELRRLRAEASKIDLDGGEVTSIAKARRLQSEAARRVDDAEASLFGMIEQQHFADRVVTPKDVCDALPNGTVLIDFARALSPTAGLRYVAFDVHNDGSIGLRDVGSVDDIDAKIENFTAEVSKRPSVSSERANASSANSYDITDVLAVTLLGSMTLPESILVAPVGLIATLPFAALPSGSGKNRELVCDHTISLVPSGRWLADAVGKRDAQAGSPIVIGNPDFDFGFDEDLPFSVRWRQPRLSAAEGEARGVSEVLGVSPSVGAAATRERFLAIKAPRILHVATHGTFLSAIGSLEEAKEPRASIGHLVGGVYIEEEEDFEAYNPLGASSSSVGAGLTPTELQRQRSIAREMWLKKIGPLDRQSRSVLMFAGVNAWLSGAETPEAVSNGMVSAAEFALFDLNGTELVVLSGCETASGTIDYVDGTVLGLRRSALLAGARTSISTLWKVDDEATATLMCSFYRHLQAGDDRAEALRQAQLEVRNRLPQPYFWAAPVLEGDRGKLAEQGARSDKLAAAKKIDPELQMLQ